MTGLLDDERWANRLCAGAFGSFHQGQQWVTVRGKIPTYPF
ncbi:hypothetical protein [Pseudonocardia sp. TRM90224]|nr:hypothetical protein [Pseudonocardia sp. TRM90224]